MMAPRRHSRHITRFARLHVLHDLARFPKGSIIVGTHFLGLLAYYRGDFPLYCVRHAAAFRCSPRPAGEERGV
ncbi:hypothetical protein Cenrod_1401 [Candidatus Symbiobacter mobilis CR]|uniref:Uncharacterized protein n=1 Tax=Candidatus Symbiobacter mobilis CR TaxID=946483 RepID=U5NB78_9BURK|nr:hypothetical protein Cenrod_1401 [Candidatus Symbiobacter mobilis CR]